MYPGALLFIDNDKHGGKKVRLDLRGSTVPLRRVLHPSVLQISPFAGRDIHHPCDLRRVRRGDDRELHHR